MLVSLFQHTYPAARCFPAYPATMAPPRSVYYDRVTGHYYDADDIDAVNAALAHRRRQHQIAQLQRQEEERLMAEEIARRRRIQYLAQVEQQLQQRRRAAINAAYEGIIRQKRAGAERLQWMGCPRRQGTTAADDEPMVSDVEPVATPTTPPRPTLDPETAAIRIQSCYRRHTILHRRLPALSRAASTISTALSDLDSLQQRIPAREKRSRLEYEELATRLLTRLDSVESAGMAVIRDARKAAVKRVEAFLAEVEALNLLAISEMSHDGEESPQEDVSMAETDAAEPASLESTSDSVNEDEYVLV